VNFFEIPVVDLRIFYIRTILPLFVLPALKMLKTNNVFLCGNVTSNENINFIYLSLPFTMKHINHYGNYGIFFHNIKYRDQFARIIFISSFFIKNINFNFFKSNQTKCIAIFVLYRVDNHMDEKLKKYILHWRSYKG